MLNGHLASLNVIIAGDVSETLNLHDFINCDVVCFYWLWCCDEKNNTRWDLFGYEVDGILFYVGV